MTTLDQRSVLACSVELAVLSSEADGPIGQAQQKGVISTVACFAAGTTVFLGTSYGICPHGRTEKIRTDCSNFGGWGGVGLGSVCTLTPMAVASPTRAIVIGVVFALLVVPAIPYYRTPPEWSVIGVLRTIYPALLVLFGQLCIAQGQDRERAERQRDEQP